MLIGSSGLIIGFSLLRVGDYPIEALHGIIIIILASIIIILLMVIFTFPPPEIKELERNTQLAIIISIVLYFSALIFFISAFTGIKSDLLSLMVLIYFLILIVFAGGLIIMLMLANKKIKNRKNN
jgi:ABC-type transport system involved in multi-copper enzyme maturation permease subunit